MISSGNGFDKMRIEMVLLTKVLSKPRQLALSHVQPMLPRYHRYQVELKTGETRMLRYLVPSTVSGSVWPTGIASGGHRVQVLNDKPDQSSSPRY